MSGLLSNDKFDDVEQFIINTGNIMSLHDITKKSGQGVTEELKEAINITINQHQNGNTPPIDGTPLIINRLNDDLLAKIEEHDISKLKIGIKLFLNRDGENLTSEAFGEVLNILNVSCVQNVIISFNNKLIENVDLMNGIKNVWMILEDLVNNQKINQIGIADVDELTFRDLYEWASVKPSIIQINLSACCVVPPTLQTFCKDNDVQLLTHSDPDEILPGPTIENLFGRPLFLRWVVKYLIHVKCRGVLTSKGYLVGLGKK